MIALFTIDDCEISSIVIVTFVYELFTVIITVMDNYCKSLL